MVAIDDCKEVYLGASWPLCMCILGGNWGLANADMCIWRFMDLEFSQLIHLLNFYIHLVLETTKNQELVDSVVFSFGLNMCLNAY